MQERLRFKALILGLIVLFFGFSVLPSMGSSIVDSNYLQGNNSFLIDFNSHNNIMYVGGNGQGNYTNIQDAIDNASDGDTVFVYSFSSPYYENVVVNKSINLYGENKETTVIDGGEYGDVLKVDWDLVIVSDFTIQNSGKYDRGINIGSNQSIFCDNIILNNGIGIDIRFSKNCTISNNNIFLNNEYGIYIYESHRNTITDNTINLNNDTGLILRGSNCNIISGNIINSNEYLGIYITAGKIIPTFEIIPSQFNIIKRNNISSNSGGGIYILNSRYNIIIKNNFLNNGLAAFVKSPLFYRNQWRKNYWNEPQILPRFINRKIIISGFGVPPRFNIYIPWFAIDWCPACELYDI
jgi:parallel beta-helix repeat protein